MPPLPQPQPIHVVATDLQGIDIERGKLVRAENSFVSLENFDLVKPGVIRKCRGNKRLTISPLTNDKVIAFRDWQKVVTGPELLVVIGESGMLYLTGIVSDPIVFGPSFELYDPMLGILDEAPYIVSLPFMENGVKVQYIVVTVGSKNYVQKFDGFQVTKVGIANPTDSWTFQFQHSLAIPQVLYTDPNLGDIYLYTTPVAEQGIPVLSGRQYRGAWYNPTTGHRSSLFALSLQEYPCTGFSTEALNNPAAKGRTKPLGTALTTPAAQYLMAAPIFIDNIVDFLGDRVIDTVPDPQTGYTQLQIFATREGDVTYYLVPRLYDENGEVITDENGSINIAGLKMGFNGLVGNPPGIPPGFGQDSPIYDGFIPIMDSPGVANIFEWFNAIKFDEVIDYTVNGGAQSGNTLKVTKNGATRGVQRAYFTIEGDPTLYRIVLISDLSVSPTWTIEPALQHTPSSGANIFLSFVRPVLDTELVTPFADANSTEGPFDRINDPPPMASWGGVYQNRLFLLDAHDKTRLVFSRIGDYESFPPDNVFRFTQADFDPITAILAGRQVGLVSQGADQRLVIAKQQSTYQITGSSILDFALTGMFPETGIVHKRAAIVIGGYMAVLSREGIDIVEGQRPYFIGTKIKDLIDEVNIDEYGPCFAIDRRDNQILMGFSFFDTQQNDPEPRITKIVTMCPPRSGGEGFLSPFSTITALPGGPLGVMQESGFGLTTRLLSGGFDGHIYQLFVGGDVDNGDNPPSALEAVAITQELPQNDKEYRKIFNWFRFDGNNIEADSGWKISFSVDGGVTYTDEVAMYDENLIGLSGKTLVVKIRHTRSVPQEEPVPQISNWTLEYVVIGASR